MAVRRKKKEEYKKIYCWKCGKRVYLEGAIYCSSCWLGKS